MKANKRFITVLLAALTIFVLVPTMAFAATNYDWGAKYATVTDEDNNTFDTVREFGSDGVGLVTATPQDSTAIDAKAPKTNAYFYDLDGSAFVYGTGSSAKALDKTTWTQAQFEKMVTSNLNIQLVQPSYTKGYKASEPKTAEFAVNVPALGSDGVVTGLNNWTIDIEMSDYEAGLKTDQTVTFTVKKFTAANKVDVTDPAKADKDGTIATATVTVKGLAKTLDNVEFYMDSVDSVYKTSADGLLTGPYDGAAHTVVADEVTGYTAAYSVYNETTGKWDAVSAVSITDVQKNAMQVKVTFTKTSNNAVKEDKYVNVNLTPAKATVGFDSDASIQDGTNWYSVSGDEYTATDYIAVVAAEIAKDKIATGEPQRTKDLAQNAAYKAAVEANKAEILAWFNEAYEIKATPRKSDANKVDLAIEAKNLSTAEQKALKDKYAALFQNMGKITLNAEDEAVVFLNNAGVLAPEIEFIDSPTAMKYKAKKLKKKAASFTVTAVSSNNEPVTYKLINAPAKIKIDKATGTITLAKKLKKGTYKITVKAYLPKAYTNNNGGIWYPSETHNIKIKVK